MKILLLSLSLLLFSCSDSPISKIVGEWEMNEKKSNQTYSFLFNLDKTGSLIGGGGSSDFNWQLDSNKNPIRIDIIAKNSTKHGILKFVTDDKIIMRLGSHGESAPSEFLEGDDLRDSSLAKHQALLFRK